MSASSSVPEAEPATSRPQSRRVEIAVVGGGIVGLGIAEELQRAGHEVLLIDPDPAGGASFAAAGMLAPVTEFHFEEESLQQQLLASAALWPAFAERLCGASETAEKTSVGYRTEGTLLVGFDPADAQEIDQLTQAQALGGLPVERLSRQDAMQREPLLADGFRRAYWDPHDHQVDPRQVTRALLERVPVHRARVQALDTTDDAVRLLTDSGELSAEQVVVAAGLGSAGIAGLPVTLPLRPVYGDILRLSVPVHLRPLLTHVVRAVVRGRPVYLVPREDDTVVIGATQREDGAASPSAGGVYQLLRDAQLLVPAVAELGLDEVTARARPGTPDNMPLLGRIAGRLVVATGFFRHGVLLTPLAASWCREVVEGREPDGLRAWDPFRFSRAEGTDQSDTPSTARFEPRFNTRGVSA
ncbi:glycine oxidase ThiO [Psychromicrobium xiongbiense]|uniref:glycine oxidase ThiO n=1 Tax=Psychromicrobium xiongbiense TaxID=3051184 RepID=UPI0025558244|nr:glycine oxidase ThiO [Psychromicrobium sp. YIM S02556]